MKNSPVLFSEKLLKDKRVIQARHLLAEALDEHSKNIETVKPPNPKLKKVTKALLNQMEELRGGSLFFPYLGSGLGRGPLVELSDGSVKYDCITGIGVHYLGHSHPALAQAGISASLSDTVMQGNLQQNRETLEVMKRLLQIANRKKKILDHCFLTTSGAMANENALKILFHKKFPADRILAFENCFMGRTLTLSNITDRPAYRIGLPDTLKVDYLPFFNPSRESIQKTVTAFQSLIRRHPGKYAALCIELIQGEGGFKPGDTEFFRILCEMARKNDIPILIDEIQTFGRTREPFAFQYFGLDEFADVVTVGKLTQICATLYRKQFQPAPGIISQTFSGSTHGLLSSIEILKIISQDELHGPDGKIEKLYKHMNIRLKRLEKKFPGVISGPFGMGMMMCFTPLDGSPSVTRKFLSEMFEAGIVAFSTGSNPSKIRFLLPAPVLEEKDIDAIGDILHKVLEKMSKKIKVHK